MSRVVFAVAAAGGLDAVARVAASAAAFRFVVVVAVVAGVVRIKVLLLLLVLSWRTLLVLEREGVAAGERALHE
jgi:hypothetical protein